MSDDILFRRGNVYLIRFPLPDQPGRTIHKFAVCLQEGRIVENSPTFTCVLINTFKSQRLPSLSLTDVRTSLLRKPVSPARRMRNPFWRKGNYGMNVKLETHLGFSPILEARWIRQKVHKKAEDFWGTASHNGRTEHQQVLDVFSTTDFTFIYLGIETRIPRKPVPGKSWRSLILGSGVTFAHGRNQIPAGSYISDYKRWEYFLPAFLEPAIFEEQPKLVEWKHEEKDFSGTKASGYGLGWYLMTGFRFRLSSALALTLGIRADFGAINLYSPKKDFSKMSFDSGTVTFMMSYRLLSIPCK